MESSPHTPEARHRWRKFVIATLMLSVGYSLPLYQLVGFSLKSELYSYILLVPVISLYLAWFEREKLANPSLPLAPAWAVLPGGLGAGLLVAALGLCFSPGNPAQTDLLALWMTSYVSLLVAGSVLFLGRTTLRTLAFPLGFLIFLAPFPVALETGLETLLQHGSSWVAQQFFDLAGMPHIRDSTYFRLPGFSMQVAPECSGIHSTVALFITSLVAGKIFLRSPVRRTLLAGLVLPLALVRNGFRVFVIGELCVRVGPHMIDSWIHRHGGPFFFALSLVPFTLILYFLRKSEQRASRSAPILKKA